MRVDSYTKAVLTVIAISLSIIAVQPVVKSAFAQSQEPMKVTICALQFTTNKVDCDMGRRGTPVFVRSD